MSILHKSSQYLTVLFATIYGGDKLATQRALLIFYMILAVYAFSIAFGIYFFMNDLAFGVYASLSGLATASIDLFILVVLKRLTFAGHFFCFGTILYFTIAAYLTEGIISPYIPWLAMAPVSAKLLFDNKAAYLWAGIVLLELIVMAIIHDFGIPAAAPQYILLKEEIILVANGSIFAYTLSLIASAEKARNDLNRMQRLLSMDEAQKSDAFQQAMQGRENERQRIARELHDGLNNTLTVVRLQHEAVLSKTESSDPEIAQFLHNIDRLSGRVSRMSEDLSAHVLRDFGLSDGIRDLANRFEDRHGIAPQVIFHGDEGIPPLMHLPIYRMLQEALNNVVLDTVSNDITLQVLAHQDIVRVMVEADGKGYTPEEQTALLQGDHYNGLGETMDQIRLLGGEIFLDSSPGRGLSLIIELSVTS